MTTISGFPPEGTLERLEYAAFRTVMGWVAVLGSPRGLVSCTLPCASESRAIEALDAPNAAGWSPEAFRSLAQKIQAYFSGERVIFNENLDLSRHTLFQRQVWEAARKISYGEKRTYGWVAGQIGKPAASRAVGQALGKNPLPLIVPCHRVIASGGALGGYTGGLDTKKLLLRLESGLSPA